jgi:8-oxo-dGTP pyrophosphatase MutT (NUDIX family)
MKSRLWRVAGKALFWLAWPALYVYLRIGRRTRVLVRHSDDLLVMKTWMGAGSWILPGGGVHFREDPAAGAARELKEETGIELDPARLTFIHERLVTSPQGLKFRCRVYGVELEEKPELKPDRLEVSVLQWRPIEELMSDKHAERVLKPALEAWNRLT